MIDLEARSTRYSWSRMTHGSSDLTPLFDAAWRAARQAWPTVSVPRPEFAAYVAARLATDEAPEAALARLRIADLYLACGCARGDRTAISLFEQHVLGEAYVYLKRSDPAVADEVIQRLRVRLLVAEDGGAPEIVKYKGMGALGGWIRTVSARMVQDLRRSERWHLQLDEGRDQELHTTDPEMRHLKQQYASELAEALRQVLSELEATERNVLAMHYLDGLSSDAVAQLLRVDGSTVRRRLIKLRQRILDGCRALLAVRLKLSVASCDSLIGALRSDLDTSIARLLR
jgi:RNA polymerase sigma-70 factor, ECF subfamily